MIPGQIIESVTAEAYADGRRPLDVAEAIITYLTEETIGLAKHDPRTAVLARRITGGLLEAGWTAPDRTGAP